MKQIGMKPHVTADRAEMLEGYGNVPVYVIVAQAVGTSEATPPPVRMLCSVEIGGFGCVLYATAIVQSLNQMQALHSALEATEQATLMLVSQFREQFVPADERKPGWDRSYFTAKGTWFKVDRHGTPEARPDIPQGEQRVQVSQGEVMP